MFIDKIRQLERSNAIAGIILDHDTSLKSVNGGVFSMTGDGFNNVNIPSVLMFKDESFHLLHLLSREPNLIVYIGEERHFEESFYDQIDIIESFIQPFNQTSQKWIYGDRNLFHRENICPILSMKLKQFQYLIHQNELNTENITQQQQPQPIFQFQHVIEAGKNFFKKKTGIFTFVLFCLSRWK